MYARVTLIEIDTVRIDPDEAVELFKEAVLPQLRERPGYCGVYGLTTPEGNAPAATFVPARRAARTYPAQALRYQ
jgi:hypothetical protein